MKGKFIKTLSQNPTVYIWLMFIFAVSMFPIDYVIGIVQLAVSVIALSLYVVNKAADKNNLSSYLEGLTYYIDDEKGPDVNDFQLPVCIINEKGAILWFNKSFTEMLGCKPDEMLALKEFIPEFNIDAVHSDDGKVSIDIIHSGKYYHIFGSATPDSSVDSDGFYISLYWLDVTERETIKKKYNDELFVSCIILIDNYDDLMQETPPSERSKLISIIDDKIDKFAENADGILKKYDKDRYFFYFQKNQLNKYIESKFSVLDAVREINVGNKIPATLSIGIGTDGDSLSQNDSLSYSALDMALGRGGDQAIVKNNDQYFFYGGKSKEVEKRTRVKARVIAYAIRELVTEYEDIMIMGHKRADIDVLGAAMGLNRAIANMGKKLKIIIDRSNKTVDRYISMLDEKTKPVFISKNEAVETSDKNTLLFVVDTHMVSMLEEPKLLNITKNIVIIDHHRRGTDFIKNPLLTYHEPYASSTSELVTEIIQYMDKDINLSKKEAEALYAGIYMDTKAFTFKTGVRTFEAASYLRRNGVDTVAIKKLFQVDMAAFQHRWQIIEKAERYKNKIALAICKKSDSDMQTVVAQATDELLNITDITSAFVVCDMGADSVVVSARSLGDINVQVIMEKLGGGGHMTIAGAQLKDISANEVMQILKAAIDEYMAAEKVK